MQVPIQTKKGTEQRPFLFSIWTKTQLSWIVLFSAIHSQRQDLLYHPSPS